MNTKICCFAVTSWGIFFFFMQGEVVNKSPRQDVSFFPACKFVFRGNLWKSCFFNAVRKNIEKSSQTGHILNEMNQLNEKESTLKDFIEFDYEQEKETLIFVGFMLAFFFLKYVTVAGEFIRFILWLSGFFSPFFSFQRNTNDKSGFSGWRTRIFCYINRLFFYSWTSESFM